MKASFCFLSFLFCGGIDTHTFLVHSLLNLSIACLADYIRARARYTHSFEFLFILNASYLTLSLSAIWSLPPIVCSPLHFIYIPHGLLDIYIFLVIPHIHILVPCLRSSLSHSNPTTSCLLPTYCSCLNSWSTGSAAGSVSFLLIV